MKIDLSMERSLILKRKIEEAMAEYKFEFRSLQSAAKQEKITNFLKPISDQPSNNI